MTEKEIEFLKDYDKLCRKHKMSLGGCGCCGSPFLVDHEKDFWEGPYADMKFTTEHVFLATKDGDETRFTESFYEACDYTHAVVDGKMVPIDSLVVAYELRKFKKGEDE